MEAVISPQNQQNITEFRNIPEPTKIFPRYPMGASNHLLDYFCILGYEDKYIEELIIKDIERKNDRDSGADNNKYSCLKRPCILSQIKRKGQHTEDLYRTNNESYQDIANFNQRYVPNMSLCFLLPK